MRWRDLRKSENSRIAGPMVEVSGSLFREAMGAFPLAAQVVAASASSAFSSSSV
jgi:hypothetical protein